jgi:hypothetical protein
MQCFKGGQGHGFWQSFAEISISVVSAFFYQVARGSKIVDNEQG